MKQALSSPPSPTANKKEQFQAKNSLVWLNQKYRIIDEQIAGQRFNIRRLFDVLQSSVADLRTLRAAEILNLFNAVNHTACRVGAARLFLSLMDPSFPLAQIQARQQAIRELTQDKKLFQALRSFLTDFGKHEDDLFLILNAHTDPMVLYRDYRKAVRSIQSMLQAARALPRPQCSYLAALYRDILQFQDKPVRHLLAGPAFRTFSGIRSRSERGNLTPAWSFHPSHLDIGSLWPFLPGIFFGAAWLSSSALLRQSLVRTLFLSTSWLGAVGLAYGWFLKPILDFDTAFLPIRQRLLESEAFGSVIEAIARLDEMTSFVAYVDKMPYPTVLPTVTNAATHHFVARGVRNPIIALKDQNYVANDVNMVDQKIIFITGPNSGGKTTYCKTIVQNQILAQIGCPVVAEEASVNIADRVIYQAPNFDSLADEEGRFGTELKTTRDIFFSVTPKSLAILDEIAEGTTTHEKLSFSTEIMHGFHTIGNSTLLVTHSYELADHFRQQGKGAFLKMEVVGDRPSHKIAEGISRDSNAERVAKKIGFSRQDIKDYLKKKGYLRE